MALACPTCGSAVAVGARFCANCGTQLGDLSEAAEERKVVSILFADVTGSTSLGEQLDPERLRALLGLYFGEMSQVISSWGGTVEKYIGDAIMAVFGVPTVREDDAERALRAALEMGERLETLNEAFERDHRVRLQIRIGVNTGEVVAPVGATPEQLIVTGDAVNVAARLEQAAAPGTVLVGERTYLASRSAFAFEEPIGLELKGKAAPVASRRLVGPLAEPQRGVPGLRAPMIGRDRELETLLGLFEEAAETGRPRMTVVYGPAGIGKSRLTGEFIAALRARHPEAQVLRGRCLAAGHGITYWALAEVLRGMIGVGLADPADQVRTRLTEGIGPMLDALGLPREEIDQTIAALATTAGIGLNGAGREVTAEDMARAWPRLATAQVATAPAVWLIEDLHWAGEPVPEMLQRIASGTEGPLILLATARPEFAETHPEFAAWGGLTTSLSLRPLTDAQSQQLIAGLLDIADLPEALKGEILSKAEGNPFFVEEIIQRLIDEGTVIRDDGHWRATGAAPPPIPDSVQALVAARIDGLPAAVHRTLQEAAVIGRVFWSPPLTLATNDDVSASLRELERKGLIFVRPTTSLASETEYMFKHAVVRDVAYASLPKARRAQAHAQVGAWIESIAGERSDELAELIADHYYNAVAGEDSDLAWLEDPDGHEGARRKAFRALIAAGTVARRRFATPRAVELHEKALSLATSDEERLDGYEQVGRDHESAFHGDDAYTAFDQAIQIARRRPEWRERLAMLARRAGSLVALRGGSFRGQPDMVAAEALIDEGLAATAVPRERARLLLAKGGMFIRRAFPADPQERSIDERIAVVREAASISQDLDPPLRFQIYDTLVDLLIAAGDYAGALATAKSALPLLDQIGNSATAGPYFEAAMSMLDLAGDTPLALELARKSREIDKTRSPHEQMHSSYALMRVGYRIGEWDLVEATLGEHMANFALETGVRCINVQMGPSEGALVLAHRGQTQRARELIRVPFAFEGIVGPIEGAQATALVAAGSVAEGLGLAEEVLATAPRWRSLQAAVAALEAVTFGDDAEAIDRQVTNLSDFRAVGPHLAATYDRAEGRLRALRGDPEGAVLLRSVVERFDAQSAMFDAARTRELLADAAPDEARDLLEAALAVYRQLGAMPHIARVESRLEAL
jgi:class 3 adenylate cyclase/tetratricopeptide (TPR) repeat protein